MSSGVFGYPLCFTAMLFAIGLIVLPRTDEAARKACIENPRRGGIAAEIIERCDDFLRNYPDSEYAEQVAGNAVDQCVELGNWKEAGRRCRELEEKFPNSDNLDRFVFYQGIAFFYETRFDKATPLFSRVFKRLSYGPFAGSACYYLAMSYFLNNQFEQALAASHEYTRRFPGGRYAGSLQSRLSAIDLGDTEPERSDTIIRQISGFIAEHPDDDVNGPLLCLLADTYKTKKAPSVAEAEFNMDKAIEAYTEALWVDAPVDIVRYALKSTIAMLKAEHNEPAITLLFDEFLKRKTDDNSLDILRQEVSGLLKPSMANPADEQVDELIEVLVRSLLPKRELTPFDWGRSDGFLATIVIRDIGSPVNGTAAVRLDYAHVRLAQLFKFQYRANVLLVGIARANAKDPSALSPALLESCGGRLLIAGDLDGAEAMFKQLNTGFPKSPRRSAGLEGLKMVEQARRAPAR